MRKPTDIRCVSLLNRRGTFRLTHKLLYTDPDILMAVMEKVIVVRCEHEFMADEFVYHAYSPFFREILEGEVTPEYIISADDETLDIQFMEVRPWDVDATKIINQQKI